MNAASSGWQSGSGSSSRPRGPRRAIELVGIVFLFFHVWPLAAAYVAWKLLGYPGLSELRGVADRGLGRSFRDFRFAGPANPFAQSGPFGGSGNRAFDAYRRQEIERLETERRRLDEEAREFRTFVDDLKRAKDREEFDAYMARRRQDGPTSV